MLFVILSVVLQVAALAIQGIQCWLAARRRSLCPGCSSTRATPPARGQGLRGQHRRRDRGTAARRPRRGTPRNDSRL